MALLAIVVVGMGNRLINGPIDINGDFRTAPGGFAPLRPFEGALLFQVEIGDVNSKVLCRRVARTIYLGSAPTANAANRGIEEMAPRREVE
jgi:hypothetical protein